MMLPSLEGDDCGNQRDVKDNNSSIDTCYDDVNIVHLLDGYASRMVALDVGAEKLTTTAGTGPDIPWLRFSARQDSWNLWNCPQDGQSL